MLRQDPNCQMRVQHPSRSPAGKTMRDRHGDQGGKKGEGL